LYEEVEDTRYSALSPTNEFFPPHVVSLGCFRKTVLELRTLGSKILLIMIL